MNPHNTQKLCNQGHSAIDIVLAILIVQALALVTHTWYFFMARTAPKELEPEDKAPVEDAD